MKTGMIRRIAEFSLAIAASFTAQLASAATTVTTGVANSNNPFNFILNPGEYFLLELGSAPINAPLLQNLESGQVIASFWVETAPGVFDVGNGIDNTVLICQISGGNSCSASAFGPANTQMEKTLGDISGSYTFGPSFNFCGNLAIAVDGQECGRYFGALPRMLFDVTFVEYDQMYDYRLTISTDPIARVPESASWAMMIFGFGAVGFAGRRGKRLRLSSVVAN